MAQENLTLNRPDHSTKSWEGDRQPELLTVERPELNDSFQQCRTNPLPSSSILVPSVVLAGLVASILYLRRKPAGAAADTRGEKSVRRKVGSAALSEERGSIPQLLVSGLMHLAVVPTWILRKCVAGHEGASEEPLLLSNKRRSEEGVKMST